MASESPKTDDSVAEIRERLRKLGLRVQKGFGQNFLVDRGVLRDIVSAADVSSRDIVVEVGPGLGVLTLELAMRAGLVVAVELDRGLAAYLRQLFSDKKNVSIVEGDILRLAPEVLLRSYISSAEVPKYKVVANLPYYITSAVLRHFLDSSWRPELMVITLQREVAESILAGSGGGLLGVVVNYYGTPRIVRRVSARAFYPVPKVESVVLKLDVHREPVVKVSDRETFFRVVRAGFSARRKQLHNSLSTSLGLPQSLVVGILKESGVDPTRRAETLTLEEWAIISERLRPYVVPQSTRQTQPSTGNTGQTS